MSFLTLRDLSWNPVFNFLVGLDIELSCNLIPLPVKCRYSFSSCFLSLDPRFPCFLLLLFSTVLVGVSVTSSLISTLSGPSPCPDKNPSKGGSHQLKPRYLRVSGGVFLGSFSSLLCSLPSPWRLLPSTFTSIGHSSLSCHLLPCDSSSLSYAEWQDSRMIRAWPLSQTAWTGTPFPFRFLHLSMPSFPICKKGEKMVLLSHSSWEGHVLTALRTVPAT